MGVTTTATGTTDANDADKQGKTPSPADLAAAAPTTGPESEGNKSGLTLEQAMAELEKTRKEAAKYRTERNDLRPLAEKYREQEESSKTEAQKTAEKIAALERQNQELALEKTRSAAAAATGLDAALVKGSNEDEITAHAEAVRAAIDQAVEKALADAGTPPAGPIVRGENAGGAPLAESDWLRAMFNEK